MPDTETRKKVPPGVALLLIGPLLGELVSGHQTLLEFINPLNFIVSALPYGFGAIICRELKTRWGKGWCSLALLGIAFGLYEEAIVARSFWDPHWSELGALGDYSYWQGVCWVYAEVLIHFHLTISIISSVVLTEILCFDQRLERWVNDQGLAACFVGLALWMPVLMAVNPFMPHLSGFVLSWITIAGLAYAAWRFPARVFPRREGRSVPPFWYGVVAAANMTIVFVTVFMLPEQNPSWLPGWPVMFAFVALLDALTFWLIMRWSGNGTDWDDRHKLAMVIGMLSFFIVFTGLKDLGQSLSGCIVAVVTTWGLWKLWIRTQVRFVEYC
jgi:hypothetical protein